LTESFVYLNLEWWCPLGVPILLPKITAFVKDSSEPVRAFHQGGENIHLHYQLGILKGQRKAETLSFFRL